MGKWIAIDNEKPPMRKRVLTRIDDGRGIRNEQPLFLGSGQLWWLPDGSMYVYYSPTHWFNDAA